MAITLAMPSVERQRCIFHLTNNIILHIKKHWKRHQPLLLYDDDDDEVNSDAIGPLDDEDDLDMLSGLVQVEVGQSTKPRFDKVPDEVTNTRAGYFYYGNTWPIPRHLTALIRHGLSCKGSSKHHKSTSSTISPTASSLYAESGPAVGQGC